MSYIAIPSSMKMIKTAFLSVVLLYSTICNAQIFPDSVRVGDQINITTTICRINTPWNRKKNFSTVYSAPAGWQIVSVKDKIISKRQKFSFSFDLVPSNFSFISQTILDDKFNELINFAAQAGKDKYRARLNQIKSQYESYYKKVISSHSSVTVNGNVRGDNNYVSRRPGRLYLDLIITMVYMPSSQAEFDKSIEFLRELIKTDALE